MTGRQSWRRRLNLVAQFDPHLLIVDFAMPGMNGAEMAGVVRRTKPELPILFLSGYADTSALESAAGSAPLLRKPFRPGQLAAAVRDAIDKPIEPHATKSPAARS